MPDLESSDEGPRFHQWALKVGNPDATPVEWAQTMNNLTSAYDDRIWATAKITSEKPSIAIDRADAVEEAIRCYERALEVMTRDAMPVARAVAMMNMGLAYDKRIRGNRADNIEETIRCHERALEVFTRETMPAEWAEATMNLGNAYYSRILGDRAENIEEAIRLHKQTLEVRTRDVMPAQWAQAMNNLAAAYESRIRGDRADNLEEAIRCYRQALEVRTRDSMPVEWATTNMNLGCRALFPHKRGSCGGLGEGHSMLQTGP